MGSILKQCAHIEFFNKQGCNLSNIPRKLHVFFEMIHLTRVLYSERGETCIESKPSTATIDTNHLQVDKLFSIDRWTCCTAELVTEDGGKCCVLESVDIWFKREQCEDLLWSAGSFWSKWRHFLFLLIWSWGMKCGYILLLWKYKLSPWNESYLFSYARNWHRKSWWLFWVMTRASVIWLECGCTMNSEIFKTSLLSH